MDAFKRETVVGYTCYDINAKCVHNKHRHKDGQMIKRTARRKFKEKLKKMLDNQEEMQYNKINKRKGQVIKMDWNLLVVFIILNIVNVVMQTVKSIATVKCGKGIAALVNAVTFALYTVVTVYMLCELPLLWKAIIVGLCNLVGVYIVKLVEEKARKDKLWKVEMTVRDYQTQKLANALDDLAIPYNYIENVGKYSIFNIYCATQKQSATVKGIGAECKAKYFVTETKTL